jgi:hypothetical protein
MAQVSLRGLSVIAAAGPGVGAGTGSIRSRHCVADLRLVRRSGLGLSVNIYLPNISWGCPAPQPASDCEFRDGDEITMRCWSLFFYQRSRVYWSLNPCGNNSDDFSGVCLGLGRFLFVWQVHNVRSP